MKLSKDTSLKGGGMNDLIKQKLESLKKSSFRSKFKLTGRDHQYIDDKGIEVIRDHACKFVFSRIAPRFPKNDGKQTPMKGHPVFVAQHATGTCCRICIEKWHGLKRGKELTHRQMNFLVDLIMAWIDGKHVDFTRLDQH